MSNDRDRMRRMLGPSAHDVHRKADAALHRRSERDDENAGAWSRVGRLVTTGIAGGPRIVNMSKTFPVAGTYTCQFSIRPIVTPVQSAIECQALIAWGAGGNIISRRVSVVNGMSISGTADQIRVICQDFTSTGLADVEYEVSIQVTPGSRPTTGQPPLLYPAISTNPVALIPNSFYDYDIPQDAGAISACVIVGNNGGGVSLTAITEQQASVEQHAPGIVGLLKRYDARMFEFVPISPGATVLRVYNKSTANNMLFSVAFGIDG